MNSVMYGITMGTTEGYLIKFILSWVGVNTFRVFVNGGSVFQYKSSGIEMQTYIDNNLRNNIKIVSINQFNSKVSANNLLISGTSPFKVNNLLLIQSSCASNCLQCRFDPFKVTPCKRCLPFFDISTNCDACAVGYALIADALRDNRCVKCDVSCLTCSTPFVNGCLTCYPGFTLSSNLCKSTASNTFYLSDLSNWVPNNMFTCTADYMNLVGASNTNTIVYTLPSLPQHNGLTLLLTVIKLDGFSTGNRSIALEVSSVSYPMRRMVVSVPDGAGANLCGSPENELFFTFDEVLPDHSDGGTFTIRVLAADNGIYVRQMSIYLGNCAMCVRQGFMSRINYIPRYGSEETGLDVYLTFNSQYSLLNRVTQDMLLDSIVFRLDRQVVNFKRYNSNLLMPYEGLYFIPLNDSYLNVSLTAQLLMANSIASSVLVPNQQLQSNVYSIVVDRFYKVPNDERLNMDETRLFFQIVGWMTLLLMIILTFVGLGVVFEQFSLLVQLIGLHVFVNTVTLPASMKVCLSALVRVVQLNPFPSAMRNGIQEAMFSANLSTPYFFQQYGFGVLLTRIIYPLIFINVLYLLVYLVLYLVNRSTTVNCIRYIVERPLAYLDQICRYQFLTVMFGSVLTFGWFLSNNALDRVSLAVGVLAFMVAFGRPIFVAIYTYLQHSKMNANHFSYLYEDIYYRKITSLGERPKYYFHGVVRALKLFFYAVFVVVSVEQSMVGTIALIILNLTDILLIVFQRIYQDMVLVIFKAIENIGLSIMSVITIVMFGQRNEEEQDVYFNQGYGFIAVAVILLFNALFRVIYLSYKKCREYGDGKYRIGEEYDIIDEGKL